MKNIKKLTSIILTVVLIFAMSSIAFAAPCSGTPIGSKGEQIEYVYDVGYIGFAIRPPLLNIEDVTEEPMWEYGDNHCYIDDDGTTWRYFAYHNWIVSSEDPDYIYRILEDDTLMIYYCGDDPFDKSNSTVNLLFPSTLDGKTVTMIMGGCGEYTKSIRLPDTATTINYQAFYVGGPDTPFKPERIIIPDSVKSISVNAFMYSDIEIYYEGTEEQWNDIVVWNFDNAFDPDYWAVTDFDWLAEEAYYGDYMGSYEKTWVKSIHFNVDPDTLEDLVPEEEKTQQSIFDQIFTPVKQFFATVISFFKMIVSWFNFGK